MDFARDRLLGVVPTAAAGALRAKYSSVRCETIYKNISQEAKTKRLIKSNYTFRRIELSAGNIILSMLITFN